MARALRRSGYSSGENESGRVLRYVRYTHAPGPPIAECARQNRLAVM